MSSNVELLKEARQRILEQQAFIDRLTSPPWRIVTCTHVDKKAKTVRFSYDGSLMEVPHDWSFKVEVGYECKLNPESGAIVSASPPNFVNGSICTVKKVFPKENDVLMCEVDAHGDPVVISCSPTMKVEAGDRVVTSGSAIIKNLGKADETYLFQDETNICWDDIGGLEEAKQYLIEAIELPYKHPDIYKKYNKKPLKGVLLHGPPGCGKTLLGKAAATSLAKNHGASASTGFIYVKGPELLNMYVGNTEASIRRLFSMARAHKKKNGYPAIIFIDEADAILLNRGSNKSHGVTDSSVNQFLAEMDGLEDSAAMVLLATNRPDRLDPAILREGRVDRKVKVTRPNVEVSADIFDIHLRDKPLKKGLSREECRKKGLDSLFDTSRVLYEIETTKGTIPFTLADTVSGAMIEATVEAATTLAINRDLKSGKFVGITAEDMSAAADMIYKQTAAIDNHSHIMDFIESYKESVSAIRKVAA